MNMKKRRNTMLRLNGLKDNRGVALISIMIAVAFITVVSAALLMITYSNYQMKLMNLRSKENFYETDGQLTKITTLVRYNVSDKGPNKSKSDMDERLKATFMDSNFGAASEYTLVSGDPGYDPANPDRKVSRSEGTYNVQKLASLAWDDPSRVISVNALTASASGMDLDSFEYKSTDAKIVKLVDGDTTTYTLSNFQIVQTKKDNSGKVVASNTVDTKIVFRTKKMPATGSLSNPGGVGSCSSLLDGSLQVSGSFSGLDVYGNAYFGNYEDGTDTFEADGGTYTKPGVGTNGAIYLEKEGRVNLNGDVTVVYGDIYLKDKAVLFVNGGKLKVFGDIIIKDNATLIVGEDSEIFMAEDKLPGRSDPPKVDCDDIKRHVYPADAAENFTKINAADFKTLAETLGLNNASLDDDGLFYQIVQPVSTSGGTFDLRKGDRFSDNGNHGDTSFFGQSIHTYFWDEQNMQSGLAADSLVFNSNPNLTLKSSMKGMTLISKYPLKVAEVHGICLTCIGPEAFKYLAGYKSSDSAKEGFSDSVHKIGVKLVNKSGGIIANSEELSAGDFFTSVNDVNNIVNKILGIGENDPSGGTASYKTSLSFSEYKKDFE